MLLTNAYSFKQHDLLSDVSGSDFLTTCPFMRLNFRDTWGHASISCKNSILVINLLEGNKPAHTETFFLMSHHFGLLTGLETSNYFLFGCCVFIFIFCFWWNQKSQNSLSGGLLKKHSNLNEFQRFFYYFPYQS